MFQRHALISKETLSTSHLSLASSYPMRCQEYTSRLHSNGGGGVEGWGGWGQGGWGLRQEAHTLSEHNWAAAHYCLDSLEIGFHLGGCFLLLTSSLSFLQRSCCGQRDLDLFLVERTKAEPGNRQGRGPRQHIKLRSSLAQGILDHR